MDTVISLTWGAPILSCPVDDYYVEYELINLDMCETVTNPVRVPYEVVTATSTTIEGLEPYSEYNIYIIPSNPAGKGTESVEKVATAESGKLVTHWLFRWLI